MKAGCRPEMLCKSGEVGGINEFRSLGRSHGKKEEPLLLEEAFSLSRALK